jgi:outer membrane receptor protein involved in Fe transport
MRHNVRALLLLCFVFPAVNGRAQEFRATVTGVVTDVQGSVVPGAAVSITQVDTKAVFHTLSGPSGLYALPLLPPAVYTLAVEASGFDKYERTGVELTSNQHAVIDVTLQVGNINQTVTVSGAAPLLDAASATVGQPIDAVVLNELPQNGRSTMAVARYAAGVQGGSYTLARPFDSGSSVGFTMGGAQSSDNELLLDGGTDMASNANSSGRRSTYQPPVEAVLETKIEVFQADASYGDSGGGTVNVITKSGTNGLHGTTSWFNQNSLDAANNFFSNAQGIAKINNKYNQWALTAGGPLIVPKVYNGKNKLFWYYAYEGVKQTIQQPTYQTIPTMAERTGDFSSLLRLGNSYQVYDPASAVAVGARRQRTPFPGNIIPANRISPIAQSYFTYYPAPNYPGLADGENNFFTPMPRHDDYFGMLGRIDYNISDSTKLWGRIYNDQRTEFIRDRFGDPVHPGTSGPAIATGERRPRDVEGAILDLVHTFNPTTVLDTRLNWTRMWDAEFRPSRGFDFSQMGFPKSLVTDSQNVVMPVAAFSDPTFGVGGTGANVGGGFADTYDAYQWFSTLNKTVGSHALKFGYDVRRVQFDLLNYLYSSGLYTFGTSSGEGWTNGPLDNSSAAGMGQGLAAFELGLPISGEYDHVTGQTNSAWYLAGFFQDDWRVTRRLTLNLGIRYEKETPTTERYNRTTNGFNFTAPNSITAAAEAAYAANPVSGITAAQFTPVGGPIFATSQNPDVYHTSGKNFSPRFGFSWSPGNAGGGTVVRGGFGIFYSTIGTDGVQQTGFNAYTQYVATNDGYLTPATTLSNPFPNGLQLQGSAVQGLTANIGQSITFTNPYIKSPYTMRGTLSIQHQLQGNVLLEITYIASRSVHLRENESLDNIPRQYLSTSGARNQAVINMLSANVANPFQGLLPGTTLNGSTITEAQLLTPYPQLTGLTEYSANNGYSYFDMGAVRAEKRFANGLQFQTNIQLARQMDALTRLNPTDPTMTLHVSSNDHPLRVLFSGSYELPFGKGKRFLNLNGSVGSVVQGIAGGWKLAGVYTYEVGTPLSWGNVIYYGGNLNYNARDVSQGFNTALFNTVSSQQLVDNIRTFPQYFSNLRADSLNNLDSSLAKDFGLRKEGRRIELRFEAFNSLNRCQFSAPNLGPTSLTFATITSQANSPRALQSGIRFVW